MMSLGEEEVNSIGLSEDEREVGWKGVFGEDFVVSFGPQGLESKANQPSWPRDRVKRRF